MKIVIKKTLSRLRVSLSTLILGLAMTGLVSTSVAALEGQSKHQQIKPAKPDKQSKSAIQHGEKVKRHPRLKGPMALIDQLDIEPKKRALAQQIITEQHQKRVAIHQQARQNRQATHHKMREVHQQTIERLGTVLSLEQLNEFEQLLEQHKPPKPPHHRNGERNENKRSRYKDDYNDHQNQ